MSGEEITAIFAGEIHGQRIKKYQDMYKKDDYMAFMTKKPHAHLNEMFGHNDLTEDDFEKEEYKGSIVSVIDESHYTAQFRRRTYSGNLIRRN